MRLGSAKAEAVRGCGQTLTNITFALPHPLTTEIDYQVSGYNISRWVVVT
jgi:hypothetical protein